MGHGYYKIEGKPLCVCAHGTVGLQHATMAMYNAWCDRVPVYVVVGNVRDAQMRRPGIEWNHTAQDVGVIARDYVKWDDYPASLQHFAESAVRAYKFALTPPTLPVLLVADAELQEDPIPEQAKLRDPEAAAGGLPAGRFGRGRRDRAAAGECRKPGPHRRPLCPHRERRQASGGTGRGAAVPRSSTPAAGSTARPGTAQPKRTRALPCRTGRRHARPGDERFLGLAQLLPRQRAPHARGRSSRPAPRPSASAPAIST